MFANRFQRRPRLAGRSAAGVQRRTSRSTEGRRGGLLVEVIVSLAVLGTVFKLLLPTLGAFQTQRRYAVQRQTALEEVSNLLEAASQWPWDRITLERLQSQELSAPARRLLPGAEIRVRLVESETPLARQLTLELYWHDQAGTRVSPVRLTGWVHRRREVGS